MFRIITPVTSTIDVIINAFIRLFYAIFSASNSSYMNLLIQTIMGNPLLLVSVSLVTLGFVIGILRRLITL